MAGQARIRTVQSEPSAWTPRIRLVSQGVRHLSIVRRMPVSNRSNGEVIMPLVTRTSSQKITVATASQNQ